MSRWHEAFDAQIDVARLWRSEIGLSYARGFVESIRRATDQHAQGNDDALSYFSGVNIDASEYAKWRAAQSAQNYLSMLTEADDADDPERGLVKMETRKVRNAEPIFVSAEMLDLVEAASEGFVPEPLMPTDLITPYGFLLLPRSLSFLDAHMKRSSFRALCWMPARAPGKGRDGISLSLYSYRPDATNPELDDYALDLQKLFAERASEVPLWGMLHSTVWMFDEAVPTHFADRQGWWRDIQCLFRLSNQYISDRTQMRAPRMTRKRAEREDFEDRYVTVITLRRPRSHREGEPSTVEWRHQWIVGGHWRNQYYPSLNMHRQIWIAPYIKGPEDKELEIRQIRAFEVVR